VGVREVGCVVIIRQQTWWLSLLQSGWYVSVDLFYLLFPLSVIRMFTTLAIARVLLRPSRCVCVCVCVYVLARCHAQMLVQILVSSTQPNPYPSLLDVCSPLGIMSGYLVSGMLTKYSPANWLISFWVQIYALAPFCLLLYLVPDSYINPSLMSFASPNKIRFSLNAEPTAKATNGTSTPTIVADSEYTPLADEAGGHVATIAVPGPDDPTPPSAISPTADCADPSDTNPTTPVRQSRRASALYAERTSSWYMIKALAMRPVYLCTIAGLSALFFVVSGIQFWITPYLTQVLHTDLTVVVLAFSVTSATAPIMGVLFGGWWVDRLGGYKGVRGVNVAAKSAAMFGLIATCAGVPAIFSRSFLWDIVFIWFLLFFGGAVLPPATGILMSCVPPEMRAFSWYGCKHLARQKAAGQMQFCDSVPVINLYSSLYLCLCLYISLVLNPSLPFQLTRTLMLA
jgi:hypothetical protein